MHLKLLFIIVCIFITHTEMLLFMLAFHDFYGAKFVLLLFWGFFFLTHMFRGGLVWTLGKSSCRGWETVRHWTVSQGMGMAPRLPQLQGHLGNSLRDAQDGIVGPEQGQGLDFDDPCGSLPTGNIQWFPVPVLPLTQWFNNRQWRTAWCWL